MTTTRLYYECHITIEASERINWDWFADMARSLGWRASKFDEDEVDDMSGNWFLSFRGPSLAVCKSHILEALSVVRHNELLVLRWKIEDTVLDSKYGDDEQDLLV